MRSHAHTLQVLQLILIHRITEAIPNAIHSQSSEVGRGAMTTMVITLETTGKKVKIITIQN